VSDDPDGSHSTDADASLPKQNKFDRRFDTLDVSSLTGEYYIRVHAYDNDDHCIGKESKIYVYSIELK